MPSPCPQHKHRQPIMQHQDIIDIRGIIERVEALREELAAHHEEEADQGHHNLTFEEWLSAVQSDANAAYAHPQWEEAKELSEAEELLSELEGNGADHEWEGNWYPLTLIHEDYFTQYAQEWAEACGMIGKNDKWPYTCIDWYAAAEELKQDYSTVEFEGHTYYYR